MKRIVAAIDMKVQCDDGCTYEGVTLAVEGTRRIYLAQDGTELQGVQCIDECVSVLPPVMFAAVLGNCKETQQ